MLRPAKRRNSNDLGRPPQSTMLRFPASVASQRVLVTTVVAILVIYALLHFHGEPSSPAGYSAAPVANTACRVWPDWDSAASLVYDDVVSSSISHHSVPVVGDAAAIGDPNRCLVAGPRLNQYQSSSERNFAQVHWGEVQKRCIAQSSHGPSPDFTGERHLWHQMPANEEDLQPNLEFSGEPRTAIVLRTWDNYDYTETRRTWLRALISETALQSGGNYEVILLVNIKNKEIPLHDRTAYEQTLASVVPEEFRDMALLYNERILETWYPKVSAHGAQDHMYQALQIFSHKFPHFTHVWQLEMDARFTAHVQTVLETARTFALAQRRRNLWERNGRFYIPEIWSGSYRAFSDAVDQEMGDEGVWGPVKTTGFVAKGPTPPARTQTDWGVGEEPDLISFMPMIDPIGTEWTYERWVYNFPDGLETPRRAAFISMTRSSRRLLQLMSEKQRETGAWVVSEAMLETFSFLHGLKAVSVPHAIAFEPDWDAKRANDDINHGPPHSRAGGLNPSFSYTTSGFVPGPWYGSTYWFYAQNKASDFWHGYLQGKCLAPMMLHPIKD